MGSRTTGNDGGSFLIAGPGWKGETPKGVKKVFRSETEFVLAVYRTQLFSPDDLDNVKKIQAAVGGEGGIRTHGTVTCTTVFEF